MHTKNRWAPLIGIAVLTLGTARAVDMQELVKDLQRTSNSDGQIQMVWWMAQQFWEESVNQNPSLNEEARKQILGPMADYTVFAVMHAKVGAAGLTDAASKDELQKNLHVQFEGKEVAPVPPAQIALFAQLVLAQTKPALAATAGPVGQNIEFIIYPRVVDGKSIDASQPGDLMVTFYGKTQQWRLPLGSLLPPKVDKKTGEEFPGNYEYNPYTGKKFEK